MLLSSYLQKKMRFAYNNLLKLRVDAYKYRSSRFSTERLYCPCCGERVTFFPESIDGKSAHFRHYHGTYRDDCEKYVGGYDIYGQRTNSSDFKNETVFFEKRGNRYLFSIRVSFSKEELDKYELNKAFMYLKIVHNNSPFEFRQAIDRRFFCDNQKTYIELQSVGEYVIKALDGRTQKFEFIKGITFFKMLGDCEWNDNSYIAKKISKNGDNRLYLNEKYILVVPKHSVISSSLRIIRSGKSLFPNVDIYFIEFNDRSPSVIEFCEKGGYELCDVKEKFNILWPPVLQCDDEMITTANEVYLDANFDLIYGATINANTIVSLNGYGKVYIDSEIIVDAGNIHAVLKCGEKNSVEEFPLETTMQIAKEYKVEENNACLISSQGITKLEKNVTVRLNREREVRSYLSTYLIKKISYAFEDKCYSNFLLDAVQYGKMTKKFLASEVNYYGHNPYVWNYLIDCRKNKKISEVALKLINGGNYD